MTDIGPREIRAMLQRRLPELLGRLMPAYTFQTPIMTPLNEWRPGRADRRPGSFVIWTSGAAAGGFNEYSPAGPEASGDVIDLIAYVRRSDRRHAFEFAREFLGIRQMTPEERARAGTAARRQAQAVVAAQSEAAAAKVRAANALWTRTVPIAGSLAETYLASRRIPLMLVPHREEDLRFMPRLEHWKSARWEGDKKVESGPMLPAMVSALRNLAGDITAVHCTFLRADGSGKADVPNAKLMRGIAKGSAVWLARGPSNVSVQEAMATGECSPLIVTEGIENGLTDALACSDARVAAAGSFDLMMALDVSAPIFDPVLYGVDNDDDVRHEEVLADRLDELRAIGRRAGIMRISGAKDSNALLTE